MCDVHLVEESKSVVTVSHVLCAFCELPIKGMATKVIGVLDNGKPGKLEFLYHPQCEEDMRFDYDSHGCFSYGHPNLREVI